MFFKTVKKDAVISECKKYRYSLSRIWNENEETVTFVCLNPSTADADKDDPTIRRCINFSKDWGCGGLYMVNLFAFRATDPNDMKQAVDPIGPDNNMWLREIAFKSNIIIAGWGNDGAFKNRDSEVKNFLAQIKKLQYLKLTKQGHPWHPLYLKKNLTPIKF